MSATKEARTMFIVEESAKNKIEQDAARIRDIGASINTIGKIMDAVQMQLMDGDDHIPCVDCHMHEVVDTTTLFSLYTAVKELGEVAHSLGDGIESAIYKSKKYQGDQ